MRIALVAPFLMKSAMGLSRYVSDLVPHLCDQGCVVTVIGTDCAYRGAEADELVSIDGRANSKVFHVVGKVNRRLYRCPELGRWLELHARDFDVVDIQGIWTWVAVDAANACYAAGVPFVVSSHGMMTSYEWRKSSNAKRLFFLCKARKMWRRAARVRYFSAGELRNSQVPPVSPFDVIPQGFDLPHWHDFPKPDAETYRQLGARPEKPLILFFGRVTRGKGVAELLDAFDRLKPECPDVGLAIVGPLDGAYGAMIQKRVTANTDGRIRLVDPVFDNRKWAILATATIFVTLSKSEGGSIAVLEALSMGLPVCITSGTNMPEVEAKQAGITTSCEPDVAAADLARLLNDPDRLAMFRRNAKRLADDFKWSVVLPRLLRFYDHAISGE